jgi:hypothetical protein
VFLLAGNGKVGSSLEEIAEESKKKRERDEAELKEQMKAGMLVNDTIEFVRNIQVCVCVCGFVGVAGDGYLGVGVCKVVGLWVGVWRLMWVGIWMQDSNGPRSG